MGNSRSRNVRASPDAHEFNLMYRDWQSDQDITGEALVETQEKEPSFVVGALFRAGFVLLIVSVFASNAAFNIVLDVRRRLMAESTHFQKRLDGYSRWQQSSAGKDWMAQMFWIHLVCLAFDLALFLFYFIRYRRIRSMIIGLILFLWSWIAFYHQAMQPAFIAWSQVMNFGTGTKNSTTTTTLENGTLYALSLVDFSSALSTWGVLAHSMMCCWLAFEADRMARGAFWSNLVCLVGHYGLLASFASCILLGQPPNVCLYILASYTMAWGIYKLFGS